MRCIIGASLSEPHTGELVGKTELYVCLSIRPSTSYVLVLVLNNFYLSVDSNITNNLEDEMEGGGAG